MKNSVADYNPAVSRLLERSFANRFVRARTEGVDVYTYKRSTINGPIRVSGF
jgi:hypothetical protein